MKYTLSLAKVLSQKHLHVDSVVFLGSGDHSEAFCVNGRSVLKLPKHQKASDCLKTETRVLRAVEGRLPLETPRVLFDGVFSDNGETFAYSISKRVQGKKLSRAEFQALDEPTAMKNAELIAGFLFRLHHQRQALAIRRKDLCLLHGDFSLNHVLFDESGLARGVLDLGDSRAGKPMTDFVYLLDDEDDEEFGAGFGELVLRIYRGLELRQAP